MKALIRSVFMLLSITYYVLPSTAQYSEMTIEYAEGKTRMMDQYLGILSAHYQIDIAQAGVKQAKLWNNPYFLWNADMYSINKNRYFAFGEQKLIQVEQIFSISGKHSNSVKLAKINVELSELEFAEVVRGLVYEYSETYNDVLALQSTMVLYDSVSQMYNTVLKFLNAQETQELFSKSEKIRLQSEIVQVKVNYNETLNDYMQKLAALKVLLNLPAEANLKLMPRTLYNEKSLGMEEMFGLAVLNRPDYLIGLKRVAYAERDLKLQKSNAVPDLKFGYQPHDKGSNYARPYSGMTFEVFLPFFNRNQGNIAAERVRIDQAETDVELKKLTLKNEIKAAYIRYLELDKLNKEMNLLDHSSTADHQKNLIELYKGREISLMQMIDYQNSFLQASIQLIELNRLYISATNHLNFSLGGEFYK